MSKDTHALNPNNQHMPDQRSGNVLTEWWPMPQSTRKLKALTRLWTEEAGEQQLVDLSYRMFDIYAARQGLQPYPELVAAFLDEQPVGILAGRLDYINEQFFIEGTALHPTRATPEISLTILSALINVAVDASLAQGWRGWVAYDADDAPHRDLLSLGFTATHPLYYRKMGYFS